MIKEARVIAVFLALWLIAAYIAACAVDAFIRFGQRHDVIDDHDEMTPEEFARRTQV